MHVLIVDDSDSVRQLLIRIVKHAGYDALGCANGREAMDLLHTYGECPRLMFLDVKMPIMGGWEVLQELQNHVQFVTIPIVMISASGDYMHEAFAQGAVNFLPKPFAMETVIHIIEQYCASSSVTT